MPDALPPVSVLLATLDAATLPLAGTETTFVMQGGQPRRTPVSSIGGGGASANTYSLSGTYTPSVMADGSATVAPVLFSGYSRVGNGAGVPSAGDTVTVWGLIEASGLVDGEVITISLPFECAAPSIPYAARPIGDPDGDLVTRASIDSPTALSITVSVNTDTSDELYFHAIYQTANAVDP